MKADSAEVTSFTNPEQALAALRAAQAAHPFWKNELLRACADGHLTLQDFRYVFSQYFLYSQNFTRYLAALMANCESDLFRARLAQNLWEEGGGSEPGKRHVELFRGFLQKGLSLNLAKVGFDDAARYFSQAYLDFCLNSPPAAAAAFLSLGTEGIVPRLYQQLLVGLEEAGVASEHLEFFRIHIQCDDEHAKTLEEMIQARVSLLPIMAEGTSMLASNVEARNKLYSNKNERLNIDFVVDSVPFSPEVLDPRVVRIPPGHNNELHKHAHETVFYIVSGTGQVLIDDAVVPAKPGDLVFVPRWAMHQSQNTGSEEMVILAITDYNFTRKAYVGDYLKTARLRRTNASRHQTRDAFWQLPDAE